MLILDDSSSVNLNSYVQPSCIPNALYGSYPPSNVNMTAFVMGWGLLNETATTFPTSLYNARISTYSETYCSSVNVPYKNGSSQICAGLWRAFFFFKF
jgi:hypothetical protein